MLLPHDHFYERRKAVCLYAGNLLTDEQGLSLEKEYDTLNVGSYVYYFKFKGKTHW